MSSRQHDSVLHLAVLQIHNLVKEESSASRSRKACGDEFSAVGQDSVTVSTGEEPTPTDVIQENAAHLLNRRDNCNLLVIYNEENLEVLSSLNL